MSQAEFQGELIRPSLKSLWAHWVVLAVSVALLAIPETILALGQQWFAPENQSLGVLGLRAVGALGVFYAGIIRIGYIFLANRYYLTDQEVIEVYGLIQRQRRATRFEHIRRVSVEVGFVGRILGYGDVLYYTSGSGDVDVRLQNIPYPEELAARVKEATESAESEDGRSRAQAAADESMVKALNALTQELMAFRQDNQYTRDSMQALTKALEDAKAQVPSPAASGPAQNEEVGDINPSTFTAPRKPDLHSAAEPNQDSVERTVAELARTATQGCGSSHDVYVSKFSQSIDMLLAITDDQARKDAIINAARNYDYHSPEQVQAMREESLQSGYCVHGIDPNSCPAGCGDIE